jgi:hypothetical protein
VNISWASWLLHEVLVEAAVPAQVPEHLRRLFPQRQEVGFREVHQHFRSPQLWRSFPVAQGFADTNVPALHVFDELQHVGFGPDAGRVEAVMIPQSLDQLSDQRQRVIAPLGPEQFEAARKARVRFLVAVSLDARVELAGRER